MPLKIFETGATRSNDVEGARFDLIPPDALLRLAQRYALGAKIHGDRNWEKGMPVGEIWNHLETHINSYKLGNRGEDHLAAIAWGIFALMHYERTFPKKDFTP